MSIADMVDDLITAQDNLDPDDVRSVIKGLEVVRANAAILGDKQLVINLTNTIEELTRKIAAKSLGWDPRILWR
jgi:hypothetical protein